MDKTIKCECPFGHKKLQGNSNFTNERTITRKIKFSRMSDLIGFGNYFNLNGKVALVTGGEQDLPRIPYPISKKS